MDSDLAEAVAALKSIFEKRFIPASFGVTDDATLEVLRRQFQLSKRYTSFLAAANPLDVETVTPPERIRFVPADELSREQSVYREGDGVEPPTPGWRDNWIVIAHSTLLGDPYFLDTDRSDAEGDCAVLTAMTGTASIEPVLCATSFATFVQILGAAMELAEDFGNALDPDDEHIFKEALRPKLRLIDSAALRHGHWTS